MKIIVLVIITIFTLQGCSTQRNGWNKNKRFNHVSAPAEVPKETFGIDNTVEAVPGIHGLWEGAYFCNNDIGEGSVQIDSNSKNNYSATLNIKGKTTRYTTKIAGHRPDGRLIFRADSTKKYRSKKSKNLMSLYGENVDRINGEARYLNIAMGGLGSYCRGMLLTKFVPIEGFSGEYSKATGFHSACDIIEKNWFYDLEKQEGVAKSLKVELPEMLSSYNPSFARESAIYDVQRFENTFGVLPESLTASQTRSLKTQLKMCALLTDKRQRQEYQSIFFPNKQLTRVIKVSIGTYWRPQVEVPIAVNLAGISEREQVAKASLEKAKRHVSSLIKLSSLDAVKGKVNSRELAPSNVTPTELQLALKPLISHVKTLADHEYTLRLDKIGALKVPYDLLPSYSHGLFKSIENRKAGALNASSMQYLSGMALHLARDCKLPINSSERSEALDFAITGSQRAGYGASYDQNLSKQAADLSKSQLSFKSGFETAKRIGCSDPFSSQLASLIGAGIATNRSDGGQYSTFVRTCAVKFDLKRCGCLQSRLQSVYPDIGRRQYSGSHIKGAIRRSPLIGFGIAACGITNY